MRRALAITLVLFLAVMVRPAEVEVAEAVPIAAAPHEPVIGVASGDAEDPGAMTPTGNGRFTIDDRVYSGRSLVRSVSDEAARCLTGQFRSVEDWVLESPRMTGTHRSAVTIRSDVGTVTLQLRGRMEFPSASGDWQVTRATGGCADLQGEGTYTVTYPGSGDASTFRLTFDGVAQT
jgi:hypothetical protein